MFSLHLMRHLVFVLVAALLIFPFPVTAQRPAVSPKEYVLYAPRPEYTLDARHYHLEGAGVYAMQVLPDGTVASVEVIKSSGYTILDQAAISALRKWRFRPRSSGRVVKTPINFTLSRQ